MNLTHELRVPAPLDETWAAFNHMELIAACFPGATLTSVDGHTFAGSLRTKLGTSTLTYTGRGRYEERHLGGRHTVVSLHGVDQRGKGAVEARITCSFTESGSWTVVKIGTDLTLTGPPAQLAPGVVEDAGDRLVAQFAEAVDERFEAGLGAQALAADSDPSYASDLGPSASSSSKTYSYHPPAPASQTDWDVLTRLGPVWVKRLGPPLAGAFAVWWLVRRARR